MASNSTPTVESGPAQKKSPVDRLLAVSIFAVIVLILTVVLWALVGGLFNRQVPRTLVERQLDMLEIVVVEKPESVAAWTDYVTALIAARQYTRAQTVLDQASVAVGDDVPELMLVRAQFEFARGDEETARDFVQQSIAQALEIRRSELERMAEEAIIPSPSLIKGPFLTSAYAFEARLLAARGDFEGAAASYTKALAEEPTSADLLSARGYVYIQLSSEESATLDFQRALEFIPDYAAALEGLERLEEAGK